MQNNKLTPIVTSDGGDTSISISQDMSISKLVLEDAESIELKTDERLGYLHVIKGNVFADGVAYTEGDAFAQQSDKPIELVAEGPVEALWFDLPGVKQSQTRH